MSIGIDAEKTELNPEAREDVVRIVREAIVNAAKGQARNIAVSLARSGDGFVLRVRRRRRRHRRSAGIKSRPGFGLRSMASVPFRSEAHSPRAPHSAAEPSSR